MDMAHLYYSGCFLLLLEFYSFLQSLVGFRSSLFQGALCVVGIVKGIFSPSYVFKSFFFIVVKIYITKFTIFTILKRTIQQD